MTDERWHEFLGKISEKFVIEERKTIQTEDKIGEIEYIVFQGPLGKMRVERITKPKKLTTQTQYTKRIGAGVAIKNVYSDTEKVHSVKAYTWNKDDETWVEIEGSRLG